MGNPTNSCGDGTKLRSRDCTGEMGQPGCQGNPFEEANCVTRACQWSDWKRSSACSAPCGEGRATFSRSCEQEGKCEGLATSTRTCIDAQCPGWQPWSEWGECSVTCGSGRKTKTRTCNGQLHYDCRGSLEQVMACNGGACGYGNNNLGYNTGGYNFFGGNTGGDVMDSRDNTN